VSATTRTAVTTTTTDPAAPADPVTTSPGTPSVIAAVASALAGLIHYAVVPEHRSEWIVYAVFFTLLGAFQLTWAAAVWAARHRWLLILGAASSTAAIALWAVTRMGGLPFGPDAGAPEPAGVLDVLCVLAEVAVLAAAGAALQGAPRRRRG
jgi:hypothetical protein